jgi:hypothetical protein
VKLTSIAPLPTLVFKALEKTRQLIASNSNEQIYSGVGHGDFTLENMIWSNQRLYLIDNISTYMEGPSADAVKLEQDLLDNWFLRIYPFGSNERVRGFISSTTITNFVKEDLARCNPNHDLRLAMRIVNLLRIFPYARNLQDKTHLSVILTKLLERRTDELS